MDFLLHQGPERRVDHAMPRGERLSGESGRDDLHAVMPAAAFRAFVPGMPGRLVVDRERLRRKR
jgi:hypothetical protein